MTEPDDRQPEPEDRRPEPEDRRPEPEDRRPGLGCCYRHPDRETGIRCTRCERHICPDCMVEAAVGYQCPDCVRAGAPARSARARTLAGGTPRADTRLVTMVLLGINLAVFLGITAVEFLDSESAARDLVFDLAMIGYAIDPDAGRWIGVAAGEWWRMITSAFLHEQLFHIAFNMLALWLLGPNLEAVLGRGRFLALYLISALAGATGSYLLAAQNTFSLGASGAVFGLFGAMAVLMRRMRYDMRPVLVLLAVNLVITFLPGLNIAWQAHLGGLVAGAVLAYVLVHAPRENRTAIQLAGCGAVVAALVVACAVRTAQLL